MNETMINIGIILSIIAITLICDKIIRSYLAKKFQLILEKKGLKIDSKKRRRSISPIRLITMAAIGIVALELFANRNAVTSLLLQVGKVLLTIGCILSLYNIVDTLGLYLQGLAKKSDNKFDDILLPIITKTAKVFVFMLGIILLGNSLSLDMKSILTGMGISGIALALAAKDTISNLFGSLTVLVDRPFHIGDWIVIGKDIEGTVEEVGLRSTRIKTFYDSEIILPNGQLTNIHIDNYGRRTYRRFKTNIGIEYSTPPDQIENFCEGIRGIIENSPHTRKDYFHVYFTDLKDSSLNILVYMFWEVPSWKAELQERHRFLVEVVTLAREMNISFAFPTQTLHFSPDLPCDREGNSHGRSL